MTIYTNSAWRFRWYQLLLRGYQDAARLIENSPFRISRDPAESRLLRTLVPSKAPVLFDVGANLGSVTAAFRRQFRDSTIYAFEPDPDTFALLQSRLRNARGTHLFNLGVGASVGKLLLHRQRLSVVNSFLPVDPDADWVKDAPLLSGGKRPAPIEMPTTSLDQFTKEHGIDRIDLLKSDTQGFEDQVLKGASDLLGNRAIGAMKVEIIMEKFYTKTTDLREIDEIVAQYGYSLFSITGANYGKDGGIRFFNAYYRLND